MKSLLRRIRGALGTALTWGAGWFIGGAGLYGLFALLGVGPSGMEAVLQAAVNLGILGSVAGLGFASFVRLRYAGRGLTGISTRWFGLSGGAAAAGLVLGTVVVGRFLTGVPSLDWITLAVSGVVAAALGGATATASIVAAKSAAGALPEGHASTGLGGDVDQGGDRALRAG